MVTFACSWPIRNALHGSSTVPGEGRSLIWHVLMCWTGYGWTRCLFGLETFQRVWRLAMSDLHLQYQEPMAIPIIFSLNICSHDFSVENHLLLYAKQSKSGSECSVSCLKQWSEMRSFCLKQGRGLRASAAHLWPNFPWIPPPPPPRAQYGFMVLVFVLDAPGRYSREVLVGVFCPVLKILTLFETFHTHFQTRPFKSTPVFRPGKSRIRN